MGILFEGVRWSSPRYIFCKRPVIPGKNKNFQQVLGTDLNLKQILSL